MKNNEPKVLVALAAVVLGTGVARAEIIYHEIFTTAVEGTGGTVASQGWADYEGATAQTGGGNNSPGGGSSWDGGPLNSNPLRSGEVDSDDATGYIYQYFDANEAAFVMTEEYSFDMASWTNLQFSMRHNFEKATALRAAIKVDGDWYVSDGVAIGALAGWAATQLWEVEATNTTWYALNFTPGTTLSVGASTTLPTTGMAQGFGFYADALSEWNRVRADSFIVSGESASSVEGLELRYQELWSNGTGDNLYFNTSLYGWRQYALHGGTDWKDIGTDCHVAPAPGGGGIPEGGSTNSAPLYVDGTDGYVYSYAWTSVSREQIIFQDEYTLDVEDLPRMFFKWEYKNMLKYQRYRALIAVAPTALLSGWDIDTVDWYATEVLVVTSTPEADGWRYTRDLDLGSASWYTVNVVEGSDISIGSATNAPTSGYIVGSGIYVEGKTGHHRFDDFAVKVLPKSPPPPIGDIAVDYLGAPGLALTWSTTNGYDYTLLKKTDLTSSTWNVYSNGIPGGASSVTVTTEVDSAEAAFYKVTSE